MEKNIYLELLKKLFLILVLCCLCCLMSGCVFQKKNHVSDKLFWSISFNNIQACEEALREGNVNLEKLKKGECTEFDEYDRRALGLAISARTNPRIIEMLIEYGADVNSVLKDGTTYLMAAVINRDYDLCELLLENGADVNAKSQYGCTAMDELFGAVQYESSHVSVDELWKYANLLLENGATITLNTLEMYIEAQGYTCSKLLINQLEQKGEKIDLSEDLIYAMTGDSEGLLEYLNNEDISDKETVLRYAVANCDKKTLEKLKECGCDFGYIDESGQTLLHIAAKYNSPEVVDYVMKQVINPESCTDFYQWNALTMALVGEKIDNIRLLLDSGMKWQREGTDGGDSWIAACMSSSEKPLEILLEYGIEPTSEEILYGYEDCNDKTIDFLINNISYLEEWDGATGFATMCYLKPEYAKRMLEANPNIEITPLILEYSISGEDETLAMDVIHKAKNLNVYYTMSPLENAVVSGNLELVKYLVKEGADINYLIDGRDEKYTVMHTAAENLSSDILDYLIEQGGDLSVRDSEGLLPVDWAKEADMEDNVKRLQ